MLYRPECWEENSALNRSCWFTGSSMFHHLQPHAVSSDRKKLYHGYKRRKKGSWSEDCLGFSLDTECWALCQRRGSDEGILLHAERIQLRWFGHLTRMLSGCLYVRCFRHVLLRGGPGADTPERLCHSDGIIISRCPTIRAGVGGLERWRFGISA